MMAIRNPGPSKAQTIGTGIVGGFIILLALLIMAAALFVIVTGCVLLYRAVWQ